MYQQLPKPFFVLAPMDDVTDTVFRRVVAGCARPDLFFTEFVSVEGLQSKGREKLLKKLQHTAEEQPLIVQIWGKQPENFYKTTRQIADGSLLDEINWLASRTGTSLEQSTTKKPGTAAHQSKGFAGIDLNFGCPDKTIVKNGCCGALIENRELALEIIQAAKEGSGSLPFSVKTRLGFASVDLSWHELLLQQKLNALTIHGRTVRQMSDVPADWDMIGRVRELRDALSPATVIIGNGDVLSRPQGYALAEKHGVDGVMIGRGIFQDPYVFAGETNAKPWENFTKAQRLDLFRRHIRLFADTWTPDERRIHTLNKFCKMYINGFDGAKELRDQLMRATTTTDLLQTIELQKTS